MPNLYTYLISSLPLLRFGAPAPFSYGHFLARCQELIPDKDFKALSDPGYLLEPALVKEIRYFETALANELVKIRASRRKTVAEKYLKPDGYAGPSIYHIALAAHRNPSPLEAEKYLDQERWSWLEEKSFGHYFDLEALIIYGRKLLILERWDKINSASPARLLEETVH